MGLKAELANVRTRAAELLKLDRDLTPDELREADRLATKAQHLQAEIEKSDRSQAQLRTIEGLGGPVTDDEMTGTASVALKTPWRGAGPHPWRAKIIEAASGKQLAPGGVSVPSLLPAPAEMGQAPTTLLALLPRQNLEGTNQVSFLQQTALDSAADIVKPGALKPTSDYEFNLVTGQVVVVAELAGPYDRFLFADFTQLDRVLGAQMQVGVQRRVEQYAIAQLEAAATDGPGGEFVEAVRLAIAGLEETGIVPNGIVMNPQDSAAIDLLQDFGGAYYGGGPFQLGPNRLWGLARVSNAGMEQGTAILADFRQTLLWERGSVEVTWTDAVTDDFTKNLIRFRAEQRVFFGVLQPPAVVKIDASEIGPATPEPETRGSAPSPAQHGSHSTPSSAASTGGKKPQ